jgi:zinc/manganese transport system substrate-binding protein
MNRRAFGASKCYERNNMKRLVIALCALLVCGLARPAAAKVQVVTTIETLADLARKVGGNRVEARALCRGYQDPHFVDPRPNLMLALNRADLLVYVGLELEIGWLPTLVLGARNAKIMLGMAGNLDASTGIPVLDLPAVRIDRSLGDIHANGNPHYWIPPDSALSIARQIAARLKAVDPGGSASYDEGLRAFEAELQKRKAAWEAKAAPLKGLKVVTYHRSWPYVTRWLGLVEVGYVEPKPGIQPSASHIAQLIGTMKSEGVKVLFLEPFYPHNIVDLVASKAGAKVQVVPSDVLATPDVKDYFSLVDTLIAKLLEAAR